MKLFSDNNPKGGGSISNVNDVAQKIKGTTQQIIEELEQKTGHEAKGLWHKTKVKINQRVADMKINKNLNAFNHE